MPTMTITRPTMDTNLGTTRPTMGTSWLQKSQTRTEVRMTQEEYRRQEVRQTLDKVSKVDKVEKADKVDKVDKADKVDKVNLENQMVVDCLISIESLL